MKTPQIHVVGITPEGANAGQDLAKKIESKLGVPQPKKEGKETKEPKPQPEKEQAPEPPQAQPEANAPEKEAKKEEPKPRQRPDIEKILADVERLNELTVQRNALIAYKVTLSSLDFKNASNAKLTLQGNGYNKALETSNSFMLEDVREFLLTRLEKRLMGVQDEISLTYAQINDPEALPF